MANKSKHKELSTASYIAAFLTLHSHLEDGSLWQGMLSESARSFKAERETEDKWHGTDLLPVKLRITYQRISRALGGV
jgi:hypothetical protein